MYIYHKFKAYICLHHWFYLIIAVIGCLKINITYLNVFITY